MKEYGFLSFFFFLLTRTVADIDTFFNERNCDPECTFPSQNLTTKTMEQFPKNCSTVYSALLINEMCDLSEDQITSLFSNMKKLIGSLTVIGTNYTSGKFLAGLESIECGNDSEITFVDNNEMLELGLLNLSIINCKGFTVSGNKKLEKLNMPNVKNMTNPSDPMKKVDISISSDLPSFCISTHEMYNFMSIDTADNYFISGNYCEPILDNELCKEPTNGCTQLFGNIEIGTDFDLESIKSVETIFGNLVINGSDLTDLKCFENLKYVAELGMLKIGTSFSDKPAITIEGNKKLINFTFPKLRRIHSDASEIMSFKMNPFTFVNFTLCFEIRKSLDLRGLAPTFDGFSCEYHEIEANSIRAREMEMKVKNSASDPKCIYPEQNITKITMKLFPTECETVCADLRINQFCDLSEDQLASTFKNMKHLIGSLAVGNQEITSAKFLAGLESIDCLEKIQFLFNFEMKSLSMTNLSSVNCSEWEITRNYVSLERLDLPNLKTIAHPDGGQFRFFVIPDHPDFCVTTEEMLNWIKLDAVNLDEFYCPICEPKFTEQVCKKPAKGCTQIYGDMEIGPDSDPETMRFVEIIFGNLVIKGTELRDLSFLESLEYVVQRTNKPPLISIENNKNLVDVTFPKFRRVRSEDIVLLHFNHNNDILLTNSSQCYKVREAIGLTLRAPTFDNQTCEAIALNPKVLEETSTLAANRSEFPMVYPTTSAPPDAFETTVLPVTTEKNISGVKGSSVCFVILMSLIY
ncbi:hypothetical protein CRE_16004 [Caenorhabditis remanei]|uniref:Receptor L-domain domain-containing protein n=1 Tax=Caenorhabditis remanei TaxID=31234 RepID=E3MBA4_CAERE|nr:hypothetical protein CRE_16004 [Caenorhabditis remanei]